MWAAGTAVAVLVGWSAVQAVIGQVVPDRPGPAGFLGIAQVGSSPAGTPSGGGPAPASPIATPSALQTSPPPATSTPAAPTGRPPASPASNPTRTIASQGGTVDVSCQNGQIAFDWATPNAGFQAEIEWHNSNTLLEVRFTSSSHESRIEAWCSGGQIQATVEERSS
jgi:hypothetical protein